MENKISPLEVVERYHQKYINYENAFNNEEKESTEKKVLELVDSGISLDSDEFNDKMVELMVENPQKIADVNMAALKFSIFVDFFLLTQESELPEKILSDYNSLPIKDNTRMNFSIENGKFVKNEQTEATDDMKEYFKAIVAQLKSQ